MMCVIAWSVERANDVAGCDHQEGEHRQQHYAHLADRAPPEIDQARAISVLPEDRHPGNEHVGDGLCE